jgi:hypothetical protein
MFPTSPKKTKILLQQLSRRLISIEKHKLIFFQLHTTICQSLLDTLPGEKTPVKK